jgi:hypothetical protein
MSLETDSMKTLGSNLVGVVQQHVVVVSVDEGVAGVALELFAVHFGLAARPLKNKQEQALAMCLRET